MALLGIYNRVDEGRPLDRCGLRTWAARGAVGSILNPSLQPSYSPRGSVERNDVSGPVRLTAYRLSPWGRLGDRVKLSLQQPIPWQSVAQEDPKGQTIRDEIGLEWAPSAIAVGLSMRLGYEMDECIGMSSV